MRLARGCGVLVMPFVDSDSAAPPVDDPSTDATSADAGNQPPHFVAVDPAVVIALDFADLCVEGVDPLLCCLQLVGEGGDSHAGETICAFQCLIERDDAGARRKEAQLADRFRSGSRTPRFASSTMAACFGRQSFETCADRIDLGANVGQSGAGSGGRGISQGEVAVDRCGCCCHGLRERRVDDPGADEAGCEQQPGEWLRWLPESTEFSEHDLLHPLFRSLSRSFCAPAAPWLERTLRQFRENAKAATISSLASRGSMPAPPSRSFVSLPVR